MQHDKRSAQKGPWFCNNRTKAQTTHSQLTMTQRCFLVPINHAAWYFPCCTSMCFRHTWERAPWLHPITGSFTKNLDEVQELSFTDCGPCPPVAVRCTRAPQSITSNRVRRSTCQLDVMTPRNTECMDQIMLKSLHITHSETYLCADRLNNCSQTSARNPEQTKHCVWVN